MSAFLDRTGAQQQLDLNVGMYLEAAQAGQNLQTYLAAKYPTDVAKYGSVFQQLCASEGIFIKGNKDLGIRPSTMAQILGIDSMQAGVITKDAVPNSRILFPAVFLQATEDKLLADMSMTPSALESMIAVDESINGDRYEQPVINYAKAEAGRSQGIAQLAKPASMLTITTSDKAYTIPTFALGLEMSDQALRASTLDIVTLSVARQIMVERNERAQAYMLQLLNGDVDSGQASLASLGKSYTTTSLDAAATGGVVTQKAWVKFLAKNPLIRTINHVVTDMDTALKIENRTGKPVVTTDDGTSKRIDTTFDIKNPLWPTTVSMFLAVDANWPANTVMGLDSRHAIRRVRNIQAEYSAIESYVMKRSSAMRFDFGETLSRLFDDAFDVLTVA